MGELDGLSVGEVEGDSVVGLDDGDCVGEVEGDSVGTGVGLEDGWGAVAVRGAISVNFLHVMVGNIKESSLLTANCWFGSCGRGRWFGGSWFLRDQ